MNSQKDSRANIPPGLPGMPLLSPRSGDGHNSGSYRRGATGAPQAHTEALNVVNAAKQLIRDRARGQMFEQAGFNRLKAALAKYNRTIRISDRYGAG